MVHLTIAFLAQIPQPLVVHFLVLWRADESASGFVMIDRAIAASFRPTGLWFRMRSTEGTRIGFRMHEPRAIRGTGSSVIRSLQIGVQQRRQSVVRPMFTVRGGHARFPLRIWAM